MAKHTAWYQLNFGWLRLRPRRRFKDRLFRFLFRHKKDLPLKTAIANAIDTCNQKGILEDVLLIVQELETEPGVIRKLIDKISGGTSKASLTLVWRRRGTNVWKEKDRKENL